MFKLKTDKQINRSRNEIGADLHALSLSAVFVP